MSGESGVLGADIVVRKLSVLFGCGMSGESGVSGADIVVHELSELLEER